MSQRDRSKIYSSPVSGGGLFLRVVIAVAAIAAIGGVIWYMAK